MHSFIGNGIIRKLATVSYSHSIVDMVLKLVEYRDFFHTPSLFDTPFRVGLCRSIATRFGMKKLE